MAEFKPRKNKKEVARSSALSAAPCLILILVGMAFVSLLLFWLLEAGK